MSANRQILEFDGFRIDLESHLLTHKGQPVPLTPKAFDTLAVLVVRPGEVLGKEELMALVWPGVFVEEANLSQNVYTLRKALVEAGGSGAYIETIPRRGYRFVGRVHDLGGAVETLPFQIPELPPPAPETSEIAPVAPAPPSRMGWGRWRWSPVAGPAGLVLAALLLGLAGLGWMVSRRSSPAVAGTSPAAGEMTPISIAVLPFEPLSESEDDAYLGLGMADTLITRLSSLHQVVVRPTSAVRRYTGPNRDPAAVGKELRVDTVLDGTLQRSEGALRVSVQLLAVGKAAPIWAATFDAAAGDLFDLQDSISRQLADELRLRLTQKERERLTRRSTGDPAAYQAYVMGRYFWNRRTEEGLHKAIESFEHAIALDPAYAQAYSGLADAYVLLPLYASVPPREAFPHAVRAAEKALALDDGLAEAHTSLAYARFFFDWDWHAAEAGFERALALNPAYPTAHQWYAFLLAALGRREEALAHARRAVELDPTSLVINADLGMVLSFGRETPAAIAQFERTLELDPGFAYAHFGLGQAYLAEGRAQDAIEELGKASLLAPGSAVMKGAHGYALGLAGRREEAERVLAELTTLATRQYVEATSFAFVETGLGHPERALAWLAKACEDRSRFVAFFDTWSVYDPLRREPGWPALAARIGLPPR